MLDAARHAQMEIFLTLVMHGDREAEGGRSRSCSG